MISSKEPILYQDTIIHPLNVAIKNDPFVALTKHNNYLVEIVRTKMGQWQATAIPKLNIFLGTLVNRQWYVFVKKKSWNRACYTLTSNIFQLRRGASCCWDLVNLTFVVKDTSTGWLFWHWYWCFLLNLIIMLSLMLIFMMMLFIGCKHSILGSVVLFEMFERSKRSPLSRKEEKEKLRSSWAFKCHVSKVLLGQTSILVQYLHSSFLFIFPQSSQRRK